MHFRTGYRSILIITAIASLTLLSACPTQPPAPDPAGQDTPPTDTTPAADLFEAWFARVPEEAVVASALLPPESGPPGTLFGVQLQDTRDYTVHFIDEGDQFVALLVDAAGVPILAQVAREAGTRITFY